MKGFGSKFCLLNFRFCYDFGIFPDILSKSKIMKFFYSLSSFYNSTNQFTSDPSRSQMSKSSTITEETKEKEVIDEHLFVETLALTALEVSYREPKPTDLEKIILLVERMNHSEGPAKV